MERDAARLRANVGRTLWLGFFKDFLIVMPVAVPFFQSKGLSMQEVFTLQALFAFAVMVMEAPSGYLADLIGRRRCLILGLVFSGVGFSLLPFAEGFWTLALFETALAISHSLTSGADLALLYDTELARGSNERRQRQVVGKLFAVRTLAQGAAGVACTLLLLWGALSDVVAAQVLVGWLPLLLALRLREPPTARLSAESHTANMVRITRHLLRDDSVLRLVFLALCIWSLTTFYAVWLLPKLWEQQGLGLAHFGYLWGGLCVLSAVAGRWTHKLEDRIGPAGVLAIMGPAAGAGLSGPRPLGRGRWAGGRLDVLHRPRPRHGDSHRRLEQPGAERVPGHRQLADQLRVPRPLRRHRPAGGAGLRPLGPRHHPADAGGAEPRHLRQPHRAAHHRRSRTRH